VKEAIVQTKTGHELRKLCPAKKLNVYKKI